MHSVGETAVRGSLIDYVYTALDGSPKVSKNLTAQQRVKILDPWSPRPHARFC